MEPIDLCSSSSSSNSSSEKASNNTSPPAKKVHARRSLLHFQGPLNTLSATLPLPSKRNSAPKSVTKGKAKPAKTWVAPIAIDFSSDEEPEPSKTDGPLPGRMEEIDASSSNDVDANATGSVECETNIEDSALQEPEAEIKFKSTQEDKREETIPPLTNGENSSVGLETNNEETSIPEHVAETTFNSTQPETISQTSQVTQQTEVKSPNSHSPNSPNQPAKSSFSAAALLKKRKAPTSPIDSGNIGSFFCHARSSEVIKIVNQVVEEQEDDFARMTADAKKRRNVQPKEPFKLNFSCIKTISQQKSNQDSVKELPQEEKEQSWEKLLKDGPLVLEKRKSFGEKRPEREKAKTPATTTNQTFNGIDPELMAALQQMDHTADFTSPGNTAEDQIVTDYCVAEVGARFTDAEAKPGAPPRPLMAFRISNKSTFGAIKQAYCQSKKISAVGLVLTYKDSPLFDSVVISQSGIGPDQHTGKLHLVLYDKEVLRRMKAEHQKSSEAALKILAEESPSADPLDVSAYMQDGAASDNDGGDYPSADGSITIKVQVGKNSSEPLRIKQDATLQDLFDLYRAQNPDADKPDIRPRFIFDGDVIPMSKTIAEAELENGDQIELRL